MGTDNIIVPILQRRYWRTRWALALALWFSAGHTFAASILFIGNSFTFAYGSPVRYYRPDSVTDLNSAGQGGVPALFKSFTAQTGLSYDVYLETEPGVGIDWHLDHKLEIIGQHSWDAVVMHGFSTLDPKRPGDPTLLVANVRQMAQFLRTKNAKADIHIMATWPRADQVYLPKGAWYGKPIEAMARDVRDGYDRAAAGTSGITVVPVGDAWVRAMHTGVADSNPYDGIDADKINLWTYDAYHASTTAIIWKRWCCSATSRATIPVPSARMNVRASSWASRAHKSARFSRWRLISWRPKVHCTQRPPNRRAKPPRPLGAVPRIEANSFFTSAILLNI
jgi:hypothetical protein